MEESRALGDIRVLDLANPLGVYCGKLLADLGADVIKIETPGGDPMRQIGPFYHDEPHPEKSLFWSYFNTNKRSITLDLESTEGQQIFRELAKSADVVLETFPPGYSEKLGLDYKALNKLNPGLIVTSITPFGLTGPYRDFKASNLIGVAMAGLLYITGFPETPPVCFAGDQGHAYYTASMDAAVGTLIALHWKDINGQGQQVDVAMQGALLKPVYTVVAGYKVSNRIIERNGLEAYRGVRDSYPCQDGYVQCSALGGGGADVMLEWMEAEDMAADLRDEKYDEVIMLMGSRRRMGGSRHTRQGDPRRLSEFGEEIAHIEEVWENWLKTHTMEELFEGSQRRGVMLMPVYNARDIVEEPQLNERGFFIEVDHPETGRLKYPGAPYRLSRTPWQIRQGPPLLGADNTDIYEKELGMLQEQVSELAGRGVI